MSLLSSLIGSMSSEESVEAVSRNTGVSKMAIGGLIALALPLLIKKLTSNAQSQQGAASLLGALSQHTSTDSIASQLTTVDADDGNAIIGHILGSDKEDAVSQLAEQSNLSEEQVSSVLGNIAPALMSSLSAANTENVQQQEQKPASSGLASILGGMLGGGSSSGTGSLLGMLLGGGKKEEAASDGTNLLALLLNSGK